MQVFLIAALTVDGFVGRDATHSSINWRSKEDGKFFIKKTKTARAVVMGSTTFLTMKRPMPGRKHYVLTSQPEKFSDYDESVVMPMTSTPEEVVQQAKKDGFEQLAICGGSSVYTQFMQAGVVDQLYLTIEPVLFGDGMRLFNGEVDADLHLVKLHQLSSQTVVMEYEVKKEG